MKIETAIGMDPISWLSEWYWAFMQESEYCYEKAHGIFAELNRMKDECDKDIKGNYIDWDYETEMALYRQSIIAEEKYYEDKYSRFF